MIGNKLIQRNDSEQSDHLLHIRISVMSLKANATAKINQKELSITWKKKKR